MQNVLVISPAPVRDPAASLVRALGEVGSYRVARTALDGPKDTAGAFCAAFEGRIPDVIVADLSTAIDCLPLRHIRRLLRHTWGSDLPVPPCLALLDPHHLGLPDWPAYADDFLLPPYNPREALARISHLLFRKRHVQFGDIVTFADILLDVAGGRAQDMDGRILPLTPREYDLLHFLATHRGKFFARDRLVDMVWGVNFDGGERTVDIHIRRLRAKLPPGTAALLETRRGVGYGFRSLSGPGPDEDY
jgi:DNA-binding response OmpR family regulator